LESPSASSSMTSLSPFLLKRLWEDAKGTTCSRMILIPLSSEAFNYVSVNTKNNKRDTSRMSAKWEERMWAVDVLPEPGGP
jgi:hypothetical protein